MPVVLPTPLMLAVEGLIDSGIINRIANDGTDACRSEVRDLLGLAPVSEAA